MRYAILLGSLVMAAGLATRAMEPPAVGVGDEGRSVTIPGASQFDVTSKSGRIYRIFVAGPSGEIPAEGSPVIYLSDGNSNFPVVLEAARRQSRNGSQAVVVGVGYPEEDEAVHRQRRAFDLLPESSAKEAATLKTGGSDAFLTFLEDELKPIIERMHRIDRHRQTLFGHSFGGRFVLGVLFRKPDAFQTYLASSPSIWWDNSRFLVEEKRFMDRQTGKDVRAKLLISAGGWEQRPREGTSGERAAIQDQRRMTGNAKEFAARMEASGITGLTVMFREFAEEDHGSVVLPAASRGVRLAIEGK